MPTQNFDFRRILKVLLKHRVEFIVVGGVAAVLHGAPLHTKDLDVVHSRNPDNIQRLMNALADLDAIYREVPDRRLRPKVSHLVSPGHHLLVTRFGSLDLLGTIGHDLGYDELLADTATMNLTQRQKFRLLTLESLIKVKEQTGRLKDKASLFLLRSTLEEKKSQ